MSKKQLASSKAVTPDRAARLYRLLSFLGTAPQTRTAIIRKLRLDVRGFYRDLELLRTAGIDVPLKAGRYGLTGDLDDAIALLPFPDPRLTLGEAVQIARGRSTVHKKLKQLIAQIVR